MGVVPQVDISTVLDDPLNEADIAPVHRPVYGGGAPAVIVVVPRPVAPKKLHRVKLTRKTGQH